MTTTGSCLCGKVHLSIAEFDRHVVACHCQQCRKQSGHYFAASRVETRHLHIDGEDQITWYSASADAQRGFCMHCGSALFWRHLQSPHMISVLAGCLDAPTGLHLSKHIFVADKGDYYELDDNIQQFPQAD